jgi:hypothetical protein
MEEHKPSPELMLHFKRLLQLKKEIKTMYENAAFSLNVSANGFYYIYNSLDDIIKEKKDIE